MSQAKSRQFAPSCDPRGSRGDTFFRAVSLVLLVFLAAEAVLRVAYYIRDGSVTRFPFFTIEYDYMPLPPWLTHTLVMQPDRKLFWKYRPSLIRSYFDIFVPVEREEERTTVLRRFIPTIPASLQQRSPIEVSLNSEGFRNREFAAAKVDSVFRIVCLGDSWTFGWNVTQDEAYPQQLQALLDQEFGSGRFEVVNMGIGGYSSYQGLELLRSRVLALQPDLVIVGFAMNDSLVVGYRDKDVGALTASPGQVLGRLLQFSEAYKLVRYLAVASQEPLYSLGRHLREKAEMAGSPREAWVPGAGVQFADYQELEPWTRVGPGDYSRNIGEIIALAKSQGARVVLMYNQLWDSPYRIVLQDLAGQEAVPFVNSQALIEEERRNMSSRLEKTLELPPAPAASVQSVVFRVYADRHAVPKTISIVGPHEELGNMVPNRVAMYDDGTHGDQRAGDGLWSFAAALRPGARVFYTYTNGGTTGEWEGLDAPAAREVQVPHEFRGAVYQPIELFGKLHLQADSLHTDGIGYRLIAKAILGRLKELAPTVTQLAGGYADISSDQDRAATALGENGHARSK